MDKEIKLLDKNCKNLVNEINNRTIKILEEGLKLPSPIKEDSVNYLLLNKTIPIKIKLSEKNITNIIHISDIHIRRSNNIVHEYKHVFKNLYKDLDELKKETPDYIIVITGDLLHDKDEFTASSSDLIIEFINRLTEINDVILIAGNHDINMRNKKDIDPITSILKDRKPKNLYYLQYSGIYEYGNIIFGLSSLLDDKFIKSDYIIEKKIKVGLYHGILNKSKSGSNGIELNSNIGKKNFIGYDYVLLGDIHYHQYINIEKTIGYAGSLKSQNFGETNNEHGYINWDLLNKSSYFKQIKNEYQHKIYEIKEKKILIEDKYYETLSEEAINKIPKKGQLLVTLNLIFLYKSILKY
jgi:DNA repair exonuclease SbcCD nuclease subunit